MTFVQMEPNMDTKVSSQTRRYSISHLVEIGCKTTNIPVDLSKFNIHAIQSGIVTCAVVIPHPSTMPLKEVPLNRGRGWSIDTGDSMEDHVVFPGSGTKHPRRQPRNAPSEARVQSDDGFARFLKQHSSPTHQRVTAGGRIVPMEPIPAPPQFTLLINNLARSKDSASEPMVADEPQIGNGRPVDLACSKGTVNADLPSGCPGQTLQAANPTKEAAGNASQHAQVNTNSGCLKNGNRMPRPSDLTHLTTANQTTLPHTFTDLTSPFSLNPQTFTQNQWGSHALPLTGMVLNPYTNLLIPRGEQQPIMSTPIDLVNDPFGLVYATEQMSFPITHGDGLDHTGAYPLEPSFWGNCSQPMPPNSTGEAQSYYPGLPALDTAKISATFAPKIGTHAQGGYPAQMSAAGTKFNNMTMNHSFNPVSPGYVTPIKQVTVSKVTVDEVERAELAFHQLDLNLRGHDQYTAGHHSTFTPQIKSHYAAERMRLTEQRDMARRKWLQLREVFYRERSAQRKLSEERSAQRKLSEERAARRNISGPAYHQQTSSTKAMTSTANYGSGMGNFNVQAAAWNPGHLDNSNSHSMKAQASAPNINNALIGTPSPRAFKGGNDHVQSASKTKPHGSNHFQANEIMQSIVSPSFYVAPGPYERQLNGVNGGELSDQEVDEWGIRRGCAPPELAKQQSEAEMKLRALQREESGAYMGHASVSRQGHASVSRQGHAAVNFQAHARNASMDQSPYPVGEGGARVGRAPPELGQRQIEQGAKLEKMHPYHRSQISLTTLDSLPTTPGNAGKTVSFADDNANTTYQITSGGDDDASTVRNSGETVWTPMKSGNASRPTQEDWDTIIAAGNKDLGVKTVVRMADGHTITVEGQRVQKLRGWEGIVEAGKKERGMKTEVLLASGHTVLVDGRAERGPLVSTANRMENRDEMRKCQSVMTEQDRLARGMDDASRKPSSLVRNPWALPDENNAFRNKGPSSVATQSVTARGMMPGFDGAVDRNAHKAMTPHRNTPSKVNGSPSKSRSPPTRSLREIWDAPATRTHMEAIQEEEDDMTAVQKAMYKK